MQLPVDLPDLGEVGRPGGRRTTGVDGTAPLNPPLEETAAGPSAPEVAFMLLSKPPRRIPHWKKRRPDQQVPRLSRPPRWILHWKKHRPGQHPVGRTGGEAPLPLKYGLPSWTCVQHGCMPCARTPRTPHAPRTRNTAHAPPHRAPATTHQPAPRTTRRTHNLHQASSHWMHGSIRSEWEERTWQ